MVSVTPRRILPPGKNRCALYRRLSGPQGRSGGAENVAPTGIRSRDRPAHSESLYRLSYTAHAAYVREQLNRLRVPQLDLSVIDYGAVYERLLKLIEKQVPNTMKYLNSHTFKFGTFACRMCVSSSSYRTINVTFTYA